MNLDNYITLLNSNLDMAAQTDRLDQKAISEAIHSKGTHLAAKVNRAILWEVGSLIVVLAGAAVALVLNTHELLQMVALFSLGICAVMAVVYSWKYRQLQHLVAFESNTLQLLRALISAVQQFIKVYIWMMAISTLVGFVLGGVYGYMEAEGVDDQMPAVLTAWYAVPVSLAIMGLIFWGTKWYINRMYAKPLRALQQCLAELEHG